MSEVQSSDTPGDVSPIRFVALLLDRHVYFTCEKTSKLPLRSKIWGETVLLDFLLLLACSGTRVAVFG